MTDIEVLEKIRDHFESLFPKVCSKCGRQFDTLRQYILATTPIGAPRSFDAELADWDTTQPIGSVALSNCPCGTTLALSTKGMNLPQRLALLKWLRKETQRQGLSASEVLGHIRDTIRKQVLSELEK